MKKCDSLKLYANVEFRLVLLAPSQKFKILAIHDVLAQRKSYEHGFTKKRDDHKLCVDSSFDRFFVHRLGNSKYLFFSVLLAHGKSYKHVFEKKYDGHKFCAKSRAESSFDRFFVHCLRNSKYWPFMMYWPMVSRLSIVSGKNMTVINFAQGRVSIGFSCTVSEIQNTSNSRRISPWDVVQARFREKSDGHKHYAKSRPESSFDWFYVHRLRNSKY
ncbi:hypothetical protein BHE74_00050056 [Ensete ventricosum]|nr:hypothetical protein BHE74_00050056 [Ensete ventricosum]